MSQLHAAGGGDQKYNIFLDRNSSVRVADGPVAVIVVLLQSRKFFRVSVSGSVSPPPPEPETIKNFLDCNSTVRVVDGPVTV